MIKALILLAFVAVSGARADEDKAKAAPDRQKMMEHHEKMAELHKKAAECLKEGKDAAACHEAMMKDAPPMHEGCKMCGMHKKMHGKGKGMRMGRPEEPAKIEKKE